MRRRELFVTILWASTVLAFVASTDATSASSPGEPLDCSDWVILDPGITCRQVAPYPCEGFCDSDGAGTIDNEGNYFRLRWANNRSPRCGNATGPRPARLHIFMGAPDGTQAVVAYLDERCAPDGTADKLSAGVSFGFDQVHGILRVSYTNRSLPAFSNQDENYDAGARRVEFVGFPTLKQVLGDP